MNATWSQFFYFGADLDSLPLLDGTNWAQWEHQLLATLKPFNFVADVLQTRLRRRNGPLYSLVVDQELFVFLTLHLRDDVKLIAMDVRSQYGLKGSILYKVLKIRFEAINQTSSDANQIKCPVSSSLSVGNAKIKEDTKNKGSQAASGSASQEIVQVEIIKSSEQNFAASLNDEEVKKEEEAEAEKEIKDEEMKNKDGDKELEEEQWEDDENDDSEDEDDDKPKSVKTQNIKSEMVMKPAKESVAQNKPTLTWEEIKQCAVETQASNWDEDHDDDEDEEEESETSSDEESEPLQILKPTVVLDIKKNDIRQGMYFRVWPLWESEFLERLSNRGNAVDILTGEISKGDANYDEKLDQDLFQLLNIHFPRDSNVQNFKKLANETITKHGRRGSMLFKALEDYMESVEVGRIQNIVNSNKNKDKKTVFDLLEKEFSSAYERFGIYFSHQDKLDYFAEALDLLAALKPNSKERSALGQQYNALKKGKS